MIFEEAYYPGEEPPDEAAFLLPEPGLEPEAGPVDEAVDIPEFPVALWRGRVNYHCPLCRFASTKKSAVQSHVATMHRRGKR